MQETQHTEFKREWRDEWLKWISGFANANGGTLLVGVAVNDAGAESRAESLSDRLVVILLHNELSKSEIASALGMNNVTGALNRTMRELLDAEVIEYTIPDKPNSRLQKYRLTTKAK